MNWKNLTIETRFVKQETLISGCKTVNYIPIEQIDSFGVVSTENKLWLYAGIFIGISAFLISFAQSLQQAFIPGLISAGLVFTYYATRKTWLNITSSQTKFSVQVVTSEEEILAVDSFVMKIKESINETHLNTNKMAA